jgi:hypothetical protein
MAKLPKLKSRQPKSKRRKRVPSPLLVTHPTLHEDRRSCDKFVTAVLQGMPLWEAAIAAGAPITGATKAAALLKADQYVQTQIRIRREKLSDFDICSKNELLLNLKQIAFDYTINVQARISASQQLSKMLGFDAPVKIKAQVACGVMLVPAPTSCEDWESVAMEHQQKLLSEVEP